MKIDRRALLAGLAAAPAAGASAPVAPPLEISGPAVQGGYLIVRTAPGSPVTVDGESVGPASRRGLAVVGFDRDAPANTVLTVGAPVSAAIRPVGVSPREWSVHRIDGLPPSTVSPTDPALLARSARERALKDAAFASLDPADTFADSSWIAPAQGRRSSSFGNQRILNGEPSRPHYGVDIAAPRGAPVVAPAAGRVVLAEPDLHFEGGLVLMDHGQGLVGAFLHLSRLDVRAGQRVARGARLGAVGASGRATGPHLCWRLKWRGRNLDPSLWLEPPATA